MKLKKLKKRFSQALAAYAKPIILGTIVLSIGITMFYKRPMNAASDRAKTAAGILVGGGTGGLIAGLAGSAKWAPLGFGAGAVAGIIITRAIRRRNKRRQEYEQPAKRTTRSYRSKRNRNQQMLNEQQYAPAPMQPQNYRNRKMNGIDY